VAVVLFLRAVGPALDRYLPFAKLRRNVALTLAFAGFGVMAYASSLALLAGEEDAPQGVVALAPLTGARPDKVALEARPASPAVESAVAIKASMPAVLPPSTNGGDADRGAVATPDAKPPEAVNAANETETPVIAAKPESGGAAVPHVVVVSAPPRAEPAAGDEAAAPPATAAPATAAPTAAETAAANPKAARPQGNHRAYAAAYRRSAYSRPRGFFPFFW
jgi:hypothetical protein